MIKLYKILLTVGLDEHGQRSACCCRVDSSYLLTRQSVVRMLSGPFFMKAQLVLSPRKQKSRVARLNLIQFVPTFAMTIYRF